jgi:hypothetical protein
MRTGKGFTARYGRCETSNRTTDIQIEQAAE